MKKRILSIALTLALLATFIPVLAPTAIAAETKELGLINFIGSDLYINKVVVSPKSDMLLIHDYYSNMYLYNISTGIRKTLIEDTSPLTLNGMCFSLDGSLCAVKTYTSSDFYKSGVSVFNTKSGELVNQFELYGSSVPLAFDLDNNLIASHNIGIAPNGLKPGISVRNVTTGSVLIEIETQSVMLCQNSINDYIASVTMSKMVKIYDGKSGASVRTIEAEESISSLAYSPDGKYLVLSCESKTVILDTADNYSPICEIEYVGRLSFNKASDMLVIGDIAFFADDKFNDYTTLQDKGNRIDPACSLLTPDGKYYLNYGNSSKGIRQLDATKVSIRLKEIRLEPETIEAIVGEELVLKLIGIYSDGSSKTLNLQDAKLSISDFGIAKITKNFKIQGLAIGKAELIITYSGKEIAKTIQVVRKRPLDTASTWAKEGITSAIDKGFVPEDLQDNYKNIITRQEFCSMAIRFVEYKTGKTIDDVLVETGVERNFNAFSDTNNTDVLAAYVLGITGGTKAPSETSPGLFSPNGQFNREQAATMIRNTCNAFGMDVSTVSDQGFTDISSAALWAIDGINFCKANGFMEGTSLSPLLFSPKATYTREQSIVTFDNIK